MPHVGPYERCRRRGRSRPLRRPGDGRRLEIEEGHLLRRVTGLSAIPGTRDESAKNGQVAASEDQAFDASRRRSAARCPNSGRPSRPRCRRAGRPERWAGNGWMIAVASVMATAAPRRRSPAVENSASVPVEWRALSSSENFPPRTVGWRRNAGRLVEASEARGRPRAMGERSRPAEAARRLAREASSSAEEARM